MNSIQKVVSNGAGAITPLRARLEPRTRKVAESGGSELDGDAAGHAAVQIVGERPPVGEVAARQLDVEQDRQIGPQVEEVVELLGQLSWSFSRLASVPGAAPTS